MSRNIAALLLIGSLVASTSAQFGGSLFGRNKDLVIIGSGNQPVVYTGNDHNLNIIMGSESEETKSVSKPPAVIGCQGQECNAYVQNPLVPVLKNSVPVPLHMAN